jgi:transcriptional enhancer factor
MAEERSWSERGFNVARASQQPRHITEIEPTITLLSPTSISAQSHFTVQTDDGVIFSEVTPLEAVGTSTMDHSLLYRSLLIPGFWETIVHSSDASKYVITQRVVPDSPSSTSASIFSAIYKFDYVDLRPTSTTQQPHAQAQIDQNHSTQKVNMPIQVAPNEKTSFDFDQLGLPISMDPRSFNELISFSKSPQLFELDTFTHSDGWSSSSGDSVYPSPGVATPYGMLIPMGEQHMPLLQPSLSPFLATDFSNYGL